MGLDEPDDPGADDDLGAEHGQGAGDDGDEVDDDHAFDDHANQTFGGDDGGAVESTDEPPHPAAAAANWRTVLAADALIGVVALVVGVVLAFTWIPLVGAGLAAFGLGYLALVARRGARWATWRRSMGW